MTNVEHKINNLFATTHLCFIPPTKNFSQNNNFSQQNAILDTGATAHYVTTAAPVSNIETAAAPTSVNLPNGTVITSHQQAQLNFSNLSESASRAHVLPTLKHNLLSIGQLCDNGMTALFSKNTVVIQKEGKTIIQGQRNHSNGLWTTPLPTHTCNMTYMSQNIKNMTKFMYAALCSPSISTLTKAIKSNLLQSWPGLTIENVNKYLTNSDASLKGHMDRVRQNLRSTKSQETEDTCVKQEAKTQQAFATIELAGKIYTDQTGKFPAASSRGYKYVLIMYVYDANAILAEPIKSRTAEDILAAYTKLIQHISTRGFKPTTHWLDNEASDILKKYDQEQTITYQLAPPYTHRRNAAERAIRTWKNHFIAALCTVDDKFPIHLWDRLIPQATMTLNMLRQSRVNPLLSAYEILNGTFIFDSTPIGPIGCKVIAHETPNKRKTWAPHAVDAYYLGPTFEHYRCHKVYVPTARSERIVETIQFFPKMCEIPTLSNQENAIIAATNLADALAQPNVHKDLGLKTMAAIKKLSDIFQHTLGQQNTISKQAISPPTSKINTGEPAPPPRVPLRENEHPASPPRVPLRTNAQPISTPRVPLNSHNTPNLIEAYPEELETRRSQPPMEPALLHRYPTRYSLSQQMNAIIGENGQSLEYRDLIKNPTTQATWANSMCNEIGRLAQGRKSTGLKGTDTFHFIPFSDIPQDRRKDITYARVVVDYRPQKAEPNRTRITVGGDRINYPYTVTTETAEITTHKLLLNSVVSTPGAKYMTADIGNFYLGTPMDRPEYMFLPLSYIPDEIVQEYELHKLVKDGKVYTKIRKGMYGLPQAGILANQKLKRDLLPFGYVPCRHTPGLWRHIWRPVTFTLVVDDFGIKYVGRQHAEHLISTLRKLYPKVAEDWTGTLYCGIQLKWDKNFDKVELSMPGYIDNMLHKYQYTPKIPQHAPHPYRKPQYGRKIQEPTPDDQSKPVTAEIKTKIQQIVGSLLYYGRAVDNTILVALNSISTQQAHATEATLARVHQLLNYVATHPNATLVYTPSGMILKVHSDASYLSEPKAKSRYGGHYYLGTKPICTTTINGAIHNTASILKNVVSSASEAEYGALFMNAKAAVSLRQALQDMGHKQPPTPIQTDNDTANGIANQTVKQKHSKTIDMRYHWIQDRIKQGQFQVYWQPGSSNLADYFSKHHSPGHHKIMRPQYLKM